MKFTYPEGATPLDADECAGLLPKHITTQAELNQWEHSGQKSKGNRIHYTFCLFIVRLADQGLYDDLLKNKLLI